MGMPPPHLFLERSRHRLGVEFATLFSDHDLERDVQQQIAQLVTQPGGVVLLEGLIELERFFHEIRAQRVARLDAVPGAARAASSRAPPPSKTPARLPWSTGHGSSRWCRRMPTG